MTRTCFFNGLSELNRRDALFACSLLAPRIPRARWADPSLQVSGKGSVPGETGHADASRQAIQKPARPEARQKALSELRKT